MTKILKFPDRPPTTLAEIEQLREQTGHGSSGRTSRGPWHPMASDALERVKQQIERELPRFTLRLSYRTGSDKAPLSRREAGNLIRRLAKQGIRLRVLAGRRELVAERRGDDIPGSDGESIAASVQSIARYLLDKRATEDRRR